MGVALQVGDHVVVSSWGSVPKWRVRHAGTVLRFARTRVVVQMHGNGDGILSIHPGDLSVPRRDGGQGWEGNVDGAWRRKQHAAVDAATSARP